MSRTERIAAMVRTRKLAARTLEQTLRELLASNAPVSEVALRDAWIERLRASGAVYPDGWYTPPPHGMIVLFATDRDPKRIDWSSYRPPETWPRDDVILDRQRGLMYLYASPVDRTTGIIGDFGVSLYFGRDTNVHAHFRTCLELDRQIVEGISASMSLSEVADLGDELMEARGMVNTVISQTDPAGVDIGHTVPAIAEGWAEPEQGVFEHKQWPAVADLISHKRRFVNHIESMTAGDAVAFTVEPRPHVRGRTDLPMVAFHTIAVMDDGRKLWLSGFDELFALAGMNYMSRFGA